MENIIFVIARYNEDIEWLDPIKERCLIYNKGNKLNINNEIILDNVGRESHTYLQYIIDNYYNLPNIIVFSQGNISDHIHNYSNYYFTYLIHLVNHAILYGHSKNYHICDKIYDFNHNLCYKNILFTEKYYKDNIKIKFGEWFENMFNINYPDKIKVFKNAIFAVKKEYILSRPKIFYEKLIKQVDWNLNPIEGHFFERSWYYIFNMDK